MSEPKSTLSTLTRDDLEMFSIFHVPKELLEAAQIERVTDSQARKKFGINGNGDNQGIVFPYYVPSFTYRVTARLRRDHPEMENGRPKRKYLCPFGDIRHLYFPPGASELLADKSTEIVFVEAEKSALALLEWSKRNGRKLLPIALGGVWCWRGKIGKAIDENGERIDVTGPLSDLEYARDRKAYILFDANMEKNESVQAARRNFAKALQDLKSQVYILNLPRGSWNGPDDYLAATDDTSMLEVFEHPIAAKKTAETPADCLGMFESAKEAGSTEEVSWVAKGLVAHGALTLLSAKVKMGKTTLATFLVKAVLSDEAFLGNATKRTPVVYLTEQPRASFKVALQRAGLTEQADLRILYFNKTIGRKWAFMAQVAALECDRVGAKLLVVDTLTQFAGIRGEEENTSGRILEAVEPLQEIAGKGIAVLILAHDRKSGGEVSDATRGSSALPGVVDIVLSLRKNAGKAHRNQRVIQSLSRFDGTPDDMVIELTETGYHTLGQTHDVALEEARTKIIANLPETEAEAWTYKQFAEALEITQATARRALDALFDGKRVSRVGAGKKGDSFRFFAPPRVEL